MANGRWRHDYKMFTDESFRFDATRFPPSMSSSCEPLLNQLKDCLLRSDCVVKQGNLPSECLKKHFDELPEECKALRHAVYSCKRGMVCHKNSAWLPRSYSTIHCLLSLICASVSEETSWTHREVQVDRVQHNQHDIYFAPLHSRSDLVV